MSEENIKKEIEPVHHTILKQRESVEITGIQKINHIDQSVYVLQTVVGKMVIKGDNLEVYNLDLEKGELSVRGFVKGISYDDAFIEVAEKPKESFLKKLFK